MKKKHEKMLKKYWWVILVLVGIGVIILMNLLTTGTICRDKYHRCTTELTPCCPGLKQTTQVSVVNGECFAAVPCGSICIPCGDGVCEPEYHENKCTCSEDCVQ